MESSNNHLQNKKLILETYMKGLHVQDHICYCYYHLTRKFQGNLHVSNISTCKSTDNLSLLIFINALVTETTIFIGKV